jgi:hypothetical protein
MRVANSVTRAATLSSPNRIVSNCASRQNETLGAQPRNVQTSQCMDQPNGRGVTHLDDPALKERIVGLNAIRDQAQTHADRAHAMAESTGQRAITPSVIQKFAATARKRLRIDGGYRREHRRALAQRVKVADGEIRIMGSKGDLLRALAAAPSIKSAMPGVRSSVLVLAEGGSA